MQRARKAEDKEERRKVILGAARELWARDGSHVAFNTGEVAEKAGSRRGRCTSTLPRKRLCSWSC
jgi:DNA-binding transcriptional regulator YbjK